MKLTMFRLALCFFFASTGAVPAVAIPIVDYNTLNGQLIFDTNGEDIVSLLVEGPAALSIDRWQDGTMQDGGDWRQMYFNGKEQWVTLNLVSPPDAIYQVATYTTGLAGSDFGQVEIGILSGPTVFTTVNILDEEGSVPAPATLMLFGLGLTGLAWSGRKKA